MDPHRLSQTSLTGTVDRQTPKADFGDYLSAGVTSASGILTAVVPGSAALSAAVSTSRALAGVTSVGGRPGAASVSGRGEQWDLLSAQDSQSREYLALQNEIQRESREFNALSNVLKVRHDSAKAAINNIR